MLRRQCIRWSVRPTTPKPQWYFEVAHGCWCPITHATAVGELSRLRASHVPGSSASTQQPMVVMRGNTAYQVDLDAMTQTNVQTGRVRKLTVLDVVPPRRTASPRPKRHKPKTPKPPKVTRATTPLLLLDMIKAAQTNDAAELDKLIQRGGNVHGVADEHGHYPIYYAARHGAADSLAVLLKAGANPDYVNVFGDTAAVIAASYGRVDCLSVLHAAKVDFNRPDAFGSTAFLAACFKAHTPCVDYLLSLGSAVDVTSAGNHPVKGYTGAFYLANVNAAAQLDQLLTRHPSLATQPANDKVTPLMSTVTASLGAPECIALLCRHGADPNGIIPGVRCRPKQLAMFLSSMKNVVALSRVAPKVITMPSRLLPPHQAVPFKLHATPIAIAAGTNMVPCVKYLLSPDGSALRPSKTQVREAAILAAFHGHVECLEVIAARRPQIMRNYARQLYDTAKAHNHDDTANFMTRWYKPQS